MRDAKAAKLNKSLVLNNLSLRLFLISSYLSKTCPGEGYQELRVTYSVLSFNINMLFHLILAFVFSEVKVFLCTAPTRN
jgi:hypothetical protein